MFRDASFNLALDASNVIWIATANYLEKIPVTIRSRFDVFEISTQDYQGQLAAVRATCEELVNEYPGFEFDPDIFEQLVGSSPRQQCQLLRRAFGRAIRCGSLTVSPIHLGEIKAKKPLSGSFGNLRFKHSSD